MGRPPLPVGTFASISVREVAPGRHRARCRFRDYDGQVRYVVRFGSSESAAERNLKVAMVDRVAAAGAADLTRNSKVTDLSTAWLLEVAASDLAKSTKARYSTIVVQFIDPGVGQLRLRELGVPAVDRLLRVVREKHGATTAKGARSVMSGMVGMAMRHGAMTTNPTRDVAPISVQKKIVRALTPGETEHLVKMIRSDKEAKRLDLVDFVEFMLGTGVRIGEACALRVPQVDLEGGTVEISATVTDFGIEERPKTKAGWRVIAVPPNVVAILRRRMRNTKLRTDVALFPSPIGHVRDSSNTAADLRRALDDAGFGWVSSHTFRKTVATRLDDAGLSARQIADHLGHAQPSMTMDVYMGRKVASSDAARVLDR
ncbi:MAG TPA: site-specific integrase [Dermatophilaceae bacterium]|nr:site-specific integrase [Dermatophilaceae bacterium]